MIRYDQPGELGADLVRPCRVEVDQADLADGARVAYVLQVLERVHVLPIPIVVPVELNAKMQNMSHPSDDVHVRGLL